MLKPTSLLTAVVLCTALISTPACKTTSSAGPREDTVASVDDLANGISQVDESVVNVESSIEELLEVVDKGDDGTPAAISALTTARSKFNSATTGFVSLAETVLKERKTLEKRFKRYMSSWQRSTKKLPPEEQAGVATRQQQIQAAYDATTSRLTAFLESLESFSTSMESAKTVMDNDPTYPGIEGYTPRLEERLNESDRARTGIDEALQALEDFMRELGVNRDYMTVEEKAAMEQKAADDRE